MEGEEGLEEARKKRMEARRAEEQIKTSLRVALEDSAYDRMMNVSHANRELFVNAARHVFAVYKRAGRKLTESELLAVLRAVKGQTETETTITFHKK
ncbi:MAG: DNA-binding protein [Candidatus ainarchaeum sp.]|nr:DNA-binding protein [Candidatus ainarchaeum sp.]